MARGYYDMYTAGEDSHVDTCDVTHSDTPTLNRSGRSITDVKLELYRLRPMRTEHFGRSIVDHKAIGTPDFV